MKSTLAFLCALPLASAMPIDRHVKAFQDELYGIDFGVQSKSAMNLHLLENTNTTGAVCLDGTPAGFYFSPAANAENTNNWELYFQGGGWCYDKEDCWGRSSTALGSSTSWAPTSSLGGIMSDDCDSNPDFCNFNRVHMVYCDGNSFSGNRDDPVEVNGKNLYFRGRRIIDEILNTLQQDYGLANAENVLLTGCSAGGLATYLHTDYVHDRLDDIAPNMTKFAAASISGFFLDHTNVDGEAVYPTEMKNIFELANSTHGLNDACIQAFPEEDQWKCNFAENAYAHTKSHIFPLNSALDSWQTGCIFTSLLPDNFPNQTGTENGICYAADPWQDCAKDPENCNQTQIEAMNGYMSDFQVAMNKSDTFTKAGNGAFIHSCHTHCEAQGPSWNKFEVNGVTIQEAVSKWWNSDFTDEAASHTYLPCSYHDGAEGPRKCNPTC